MGKRRREPDVLRVVVDYRRLPTGQWLAGLAAERPDRAWRHIDEIGPQVSLRVLFRSALGLIGALADECDAPATTMHAMDGSPEKWALYVTEHPEVVEIDDDPRHSHTLMFE